MIEITGEKGAGKTQISLLICVICSLNNNRVVYSDNSWNFKPEKLKYMIDKFSEYKENSKYFLKNIAYQRIYHVDDLPKLIKKIKIFDYNTLLLDDIIPMFLYTYKENVHLEVRKFIKEISLISLKKKIIIIFTNSITEKIDSKSKKSYLKESFNHDLIRYTHYKFRLQINRSNSKIIECKLHYPYNIYNTKSKIDLRDLEYTNHQ